MKFGSKFAYGLLIFNASVVLLMGCGQAGPKRTIVSGKVSFNGEFIANGEIRFCPIEGTEGPISGGAIVKGKYIAKAKGGVPIGKHQVKIRAFRLVPSGSNETERDNGEVQYIPENYNRNTTLTVTVENSGEQTEDFELKSTNF